MPSMSAAHTLRHHLLACRPASSSCAFEGAHACAAPTLCLSPITLVSQAYHACTGLPAVGTTGAVIPIPALHLPGYPRSR